MSKKTKKFDALAYATAVLGQPHDISKNRYIEASDGVVADTHLWGSPCGRQLEVDEWSDGDQGTANWDGPFAARWVLRNNDDGSLCPEYEEQARRLIDAYAEASE